MSRYANVHQWANLRGAGDARPTAAQIVQDCDKQGKLEGQVILVTGVSGGIGAATAVALAETGAAIYCAGRNVDSMRAAVPSIASSPRVHFLELDLSSMKSVRSFAQQLLSRTATLNMVINNAGGTRSTGQKTEDGFDWVLAANFIGHFLLFNLLRDTLLASASSSAPSRVINVSSMGHRYGGIIWDDMNFVDAPYDPRASYSQAKTAEIYMASEIERRWGSENLHAWSLQPGGVLESNFLKSSGWGAEIVDAMVGAWPSEVFKTNEQGAATTVWAAVSDEALEDGARGKYLEDVAVAKPREETEKPDIQGFAAHAYDEEAETRLWVVAERLVGITTT